MRLLDMDTKMACSITSIHISNKELQDFLFSLGIRQGGRIVLTTKLKTCIIVKTSGAKYSIDNKIAKQIFVLPLRDG